MKPCGRWFRQKQEGVPVGVGHVSAAGLQSHGCLESLAAVGFQAGLQALQAAVHALAPPVGRLRLQGRHE